MITFKKISPGDQSAYVRDLAIVPSGMIERVLADGHAALLVGRVYDAQSSQAKSTAQKALESRVQEIPLGIRNAPENLYDVEELGR